MNLSITEASKDCNMFKGLLIRVGFSIRCRTRLMNAEGYKTAEELDEATLKDLQTVIINY